MYTAACSKRRHFQYLRLVAKYMLTGVFMIIHVLRSPGCANFNDELFTVMQVRQLRHRVHLIVTLRCRMVVLIMTHLPLTSSPTAPFSGHYTNEPKPLVPQVHLKMDY